ncbi:carbohydrate-binding domain-containing protein [uncultured Clostridium sp.]|uniref:carbohydrate-binding domain-containing protein n=1 Tax=uncultured Clostridium sp. TaxID=59620 RepID=UPI0025D55CEF|nr:carbohydrate-binding domain-containing protein [uncultured Clostridium sp.]
MSKKIIAILSIISILMGITGCTNKTTTSNDNVVSSENTEKVDTNITLGDTISVEGNGVVIENNKITISSAGTYGISGTLEDGQIIIDAGNEDNVKLVLNGANIACSNSAPIYVKNAKNAYLVLADGSENVITDGENYVFEDETSDEPNATIFSKDDLFISGTGKLTVNSNYNNAITSKDDLEIAEATIDITSVADGLRGKDSITISSGNININATGDGMKSNNSEYAEKGYVLIKDGTINITSGEDGIQAETNATITGGDLTINSGGGSENSSKENNSWGNWGKPMGFGENTNSTAENDTASAKGIKGNTLVKIDGGNINIDSSDDSIHSNSNVEINGGTINITSGDDGIHGDSTIDVNAGEINITKSYEGIEAETININDGNINVVASDDGINAAGGNDGSSINGRPGQNKFASSGNGTINFNGGRVVVDASGDGIDANGSIYMKSGTVIVNGPENSGNGALDYDGKFEISGGLLIAAGSSGMAQSPSETSTQNSINVFTSISANTLLHIEDESGKELITFSPSKSVSSIVISSENIKTGTAYKVYTGGESTGNATDGLYSDGSYSGGTEGDSFTVSNTVTNVGQSSGGFGGPGGGKMPGQGGMSGQRGEMPSRP